MGGNGSVYFQVRLWGVHKFGLYYRGGYIPQTPYLTLLHLNLRFTLIVFIIASRYIVTQKEMARCTDSFQRIFKIYQQWHIRWSITEGIDISKYLPKDSGWQ